MCHERSDHAGLLFLWQRLQVLIDFLLILSALKGITVSVGKQLAFELS